MNVNKKLDRFRQWGKEKVGAAGEKTQTTDDFKALEAEMNVRHEGMEKLHTSMNTYIKALSKKTEADGRDKHTPLGLVGATMMKHGEAFEDGSTFGECLVSYGQANQRIARMQESYAQAATSSWLEGCERSLAQMKDYQGARKKLESRRLAYDASFAKMQKARRDDFRADEELRSQKAKYEESTEEVSRRMQDIIDAESDNAADLSAFLEAQLAFHERARETLLQLQRSWPVADGAHTSGAGARRAGNGISNGGSARATTRLADLGTDDDELGELPLPPSRPRSRAPSGANSPFRESDSPTRPVVSRAASADASGIRPMMSRTATEASVGRSALRSVSARAGADADEDPYSDDAGGAPMSRTTSWSTQGSTGAKKAPPPPPSRKTKPPPPPPPMKKVASASIVPRV